MRGWDLRIELDARSSLPLFLQIARAVADGVRCGRLRPGEPLPGSRTLAATLRIHRNTALAAYRELEAEGWITTSAARGTFVSSALPERRPRPFAPLPSREGTPVRPGFELRPTSLPKGYLPPKGALSLASGAPDPRLFPSAALARAYRRALRLHARTLLDYGDPGGLPRLREALSAMLRSVRGLACSAETVQLTRGSQMALDLTARALLQPGDAVAVEALGYRMAWEAFRSAGARLIPVPVDAEGLDVAFLERAAEREKIRAVYVTPHHQYPTTVVLSPGRRLRLLELARRKRFAILEDDYDHEFHYEGRPVLPLASADRDGSVVYLGTLSKILAPALRMGFVVAPPPLIERLAHLRMFADRQGDNLLEYAVAELLEDGEVQRHARRVRKLYQQRRDALCGALRRRLPGAVSFQVPSGGSALWLQVADGIDAGEWTARCLDQGVDIKPCWSFAFDDRPQPFFRLGFATHSPQELEDAVKRMAAAMPRPHPRRLRAAAPQAPAPGGRRGAARAYG
ncbi:MAG TPA: PLP-dependent aminotransferase family protein [Myxococcales bacterium]|nr:PLP-dependent aminotransferase family protein [Myxococcales bacterium]